MVAIQGSLATVEPVEDLGGEPLWRCTVTVSRNAGASPASADDPRQAVVYVAEVPETLRTRGAGQRVAADRVS